MQRFNLGNILQQFELCDFAIQKKLTKEEYILLYGFSEGLNNADMMALMECSRSTLTRVQRNTLNKLKTDSKIHAVSIFVSSKTKVENKI